MEKYYTVEPEAYWVFQEDLVYFHVGNYPLHIPKGNGMEPQLPFISLHWL